MLWNLLSGAYLFDKNNTLGWFKDTWTKWGWWILSALLVLFVLIAFPDEEIKRLCLVIASCRKTFIFFCHE